MTFFKKKLRTVNYVSMSTTNCIIGSGVYFDSGDAEVFFSSSVDDGVSAVLEISSSTHDVSFACLFFTCFSCLYFTAYPYFIFGFTVLTCSSLVTKAFVLSKCAIYLKVNNATNVFIRTAHVLSIILIKTGYYSCVFFKFYFKNNISLDREYEKKVLDLSLCYSLKISCVILCHSP